MSRPVRTRIQLLCRHCWRVRRGHWRVDGCGGVLPVMVAVVVLLVHPLDRLAHGWHARDVRADGADEPIVLQEERCDGASRVEAYARGDGRDRVRVVTDEGAAKDDVPQPMLLRGHRGDVPDVVRHHAEQGERHVMRLEAGARETETDGQRGAHAAPSDGTHGREDHACHCVSRALRMWRGSRVSRMPRVPRVTRM